MTDNTGSGIAGNTPPAMNTNAATAATANRATTMGGKAKLAINIAAVLFIITAFVLLTLWGVSLVWQLLIAIVLIYVGKQMKKKLDLNWPSVINNLGWIILFVAIISSVFGQKMIEFFNYVEAEIAEITVHTAFEGCQDSVTISTDSKPDLSLRTGCTQRVVHQEGMDLRFQALDERFEGPINNFVDIEYVAHNVLALTPKDSFPAGVNEVRVAVMTSAEAAQQSRLPAAPAARIVIDVSAP